MTDLTVLSYGGGVQTFGILLMIKNGIIQKPDCVIFADTKAEKMETLIHIEKIVKPICNELDLPFYEVVNKDGLIKGYSKTNSLPNVTNRSCTDRYKIRPIRKKIKQLLGYGKKYSRVPKDVKVDVMIGFSTDEKNRKKESDDHYLNNVFPLLDLDYSRNQVIKYIESCGYEVPVKSGCFLCPFIGLKGFTNLKVNDLDLFDVALKMENNYFKFRPNRTNGFIKNTGIKLNDIANTPSLYSFVDQLNDDSGFGECESGGCFL